MMLGKNDKVDAQRLSDLLRTGMLRPVEHKRCFHAANLAILSMPGKRQVTSEAICRNMPQVSCYGHVLWKGGLRICR